MIGAKQFATGNISFWASATPMLERFVRSANMTPQRFQQPLLSNTLPQRRDLVAEAGFLLAQMATELGIPISEVDKKEIEATSREAYARVRPQDSDESEGLVEPNEAEDIASIASSIQKFLQQQSSTGEIIFEPRLPGCGLVDSSVADLIIESCLFEMKAVERSFRSADFKQLLTYAALNYAAECFPIRFVGLVNPRKGTFSKYALDELSRAVAGVSTDELMNSLIDFMIGKSASDGSI